MVLLMPNSVAGLQGGLCVGSGPVSPRVLSPNPGDNTLLAPHPAMAQTRLSPLSELPALAHNYS
jgi:hypothetical protein